MSWHVGDGPCLPMSSCPMWDRALLPTPLWCESRRDGVLHRSGSAGVPDKSCSSGQCPSPHGGGQPPSSPTVQQRVSAVRAEGGSVQSEEFISVSVSAGDQRGRGGGHGGVDRVGSCAPTVQRLERFDVLDSSLLHACTLQVCHSSRKENNGDFCGTG